MKPGEIEVWLIVHPEKENGVTNPGLSVIGHKQASRLAKVMPFAIDKVQWICGLGRCHVQTLSMIAYVLENPKSNVIFSPIVGDASTVVEDTIVLACGAHIPLESYWAPNKDFGSWIATMAQEKGNLAVVTSGKHIAAFTDDQRGKPASIYKLTILPDNEVNCVYLNRSWKLEKVFVTD